MAAGNLAHRFPQVLFFLDVDSIVSPQLAGNGQAGGVGTQAGHDNAIGPGLLGRHYGTHANVAGTKDGNDTADVGCASGLHPADSVTHGEEKLGNLHRHFVGHGIDHCLGVEVEVLAVTSPYTGALVG